MNSNMKKFVILPAMALLFSAGYAAAEDQDSIVQQQKSLIEKLDSLNSGKPGLYRCKPGFVGTPHL